MDQITIVAYSHGETTRVSFPDDADIYELAEKFRVIALGLGYHNENIKEILPEAE